MTNEPHRNVRDGFALVDPEGWERDDSVVIRLQQRGDLWSRLKAVVLRAYNYLIRLRGSSEEVAWGLAIGLFIAMTPTVGLQMLIAVPVATMLRGNPAAAAAGVWLTNPLTIPFLYGLNYYLGAMILGYDMTFEGNFASFEFLVEAGSHVWWSLIVGGAITGLIAGAVSYYPTLYMVRAGRKTLRRRLEKRRARREARRRARREGTG